MTRPNTRCWDMVGVADEKRAVVRSGGDGDADGDGDVEGAQKAEKEGVDDLGENDEDEKGDDVDFGKIRDRYVSGSEIGDALLSPNDIRTVDVSGKPQEKPAEPRLPRRIPRIYKCMSPLLSQPINRQIRDFVDDKQHPLHQHIRPAREPVLPDIHDELGGYPRYPSNRNDPDDPPANTPPSLTGKGEKIKNYE